jgi:hypothetical protein
LQPGFVGLGLPVLELLLGRVLGDGAALLDLAGELIALACVQLPCMVYRFMGVLCMG